MFLFVSHQRSELRKLMTFIGTLYNAAAKKKVTRLQVWEQYVTLLDDTALQKKKSNVQTLNHFNPLPPNSPNLSRFKFTRRT